MMLPPTNSEGQVLQRNTSAVSNSTAGVLTGRQRLLAMLEQKNNQQKQQNEMTNASGNSQNQNNATG